MGKNEWDFIGWPKGQPYSAKTRRELVDRALPDSTLRYTYLAGTRRKPVGLLLSGACLTGFFDLHRAFLLGPGLPLVLVRKGSFRCYEWDGTKLVHAWQGSPLPEMTAPCRMVGNDRTREISHGQPVRRSQWAWVTLVVAWRRFILVPFLTFLALAMLVLQYHPHDAGSAGEPRPSTEPLPVPSPAPPFEGVTARNLLGGMTGPKGWKPLRITIDTGGVVSIRARLADLRELASIIDQLGSLGLSTTSIRQDQGLILEARGHVDTGSSLHQSEVLDPRRHAWLEGELEKRLIGLQSCEYHAPNNVPGSVRLHLKGSLDALLVVLADADLSELDIRSDPGGLATCTVVLTGLHIPPSGPAIHARRENVATVRKSFHPAGTKIGELEMEEGPVAVLTSPLTDEVWFVPKESGE